MATALLVAGCSPKIYKPPALGAEYQFDRGLPHAKKPSRLFSRRMQKDLTKKGMFADGQAKTITTTKATASAHADSTKTEAQSPVATDSTRNTTLRPPEKQE